MNQGDLSVVCLSSAAETERCSHLILTFYEDFYILGTFGSFGKF